MYATKKHPNTIKDKMNKNFYFLSGLPRSGSTLLSSILCQNPTIHAEGTSAVCQLMWDMKNSCETNAYHQLQANKKFNTQKHLISSIPEIYYRDVGVPNIIDKCRSWTLPANMDMIYKYITADPKIIVLIRPIEEIIKSFVNLRIANGWTGDLERNLLEPDSEPIINPLSGIMWAEKNNTGQFLFIEYNDLVSFSKEVLDSIYNFLNIECFDHDFNNIVNMHQENDEVYGLKGMHDVRPSIGFRKNISKAKMI